MSTPAATGPPRPGLPAIHPYPLPAESELPAGRVRWRADPARAVLLVHDMQNYFLDRFVPDAAPLAPVLANIQTLRGHCAGLGIPVVYTAQRGGQTPAERGLLTDFWGPGLGAGNPSDAAITAALTPAPGDTVLAKWRYSAFVRTPLAEVLGDRDQLLVTGVYAHIGIVATACDAFMRDIQAFVVADAVADFTAGHHRSALTYAAQRCAVTVPTRVLVDDLLEVRT